MITVSTFTSVINRVLPEPHAGLLAGILFGTKATMSKDFLDALTKTGTLHIVALSGMNISILESLIAKTLGRVLNKRLSSFFTICLIIGFIVFVGPSPSVIRAGMMGSIALIAVIFGKQKWGLYTFLLTVTVMLLIKPAWTGDLSFQLSALATLGIILFGKKQKNMVLDTLQTTLAAQVFTIPLIFFVFRRVSLISPLTNVLIGWVIPPLTAIGMVTAVSGWIFLPVGHIVSWVSWVLLEYLIVVVDWTANIPFSSFGW